MPYPFGNFWTLDERDAWSSAAFRPLYSTIYCGAFAVVALVALRKDSGRGARFARASFLTGTALAIVFRFVPEGFREIGPPGSRCATPRSSRRQSRSAWPSSPASPSTGSAAECGARPGSCGAPAALAAAALAAAKFPGAGRLARGELDGGFPGRRPRRRAAPCRRRSPKRGCSGRSAWSRSSCCPADGSHSSPAWPSSRSRRSRPTAGSRGRRTRRASSRRPHSRGRSRRRDPRGRVPDPGREGLPRAVAALAADRRSVPDRDRPAGLVLGDAGALESGHGAQPRSRRRRPLADEQPAPRLGLRGGRAARRGFLRRDRAAVRHPLSGPAAAAGLRPVRRRSRLRTGTRIRTRSPTCGFSSAGGRSPERSTPCRRCPGSRRGEVVVETGAARPAGRLGRDGSRSSRRARSGWSSRPKPRSDVALRLAGLLDAPRDPRGRRAARRAVPAQLAFSALPLGRGRARDRMAGGGSGPRGLAVGAGALRALPPRACCCGNRPRTRVVKPVSVKARLRAASSGHLSSRRSCSWPTRIRCSTRRTFVGRDIVPYNIPLENAVHDAWSRGRLPVWWDAVSGGRPLLPNPNAGVFYPLRPVLSALPFPTAMRIFPVFHWILGGLGMLLLARAIGGSRGAAWVSAVSFAFSGVIVSEVFYSNFQPGASLLPWTLWALVRPEARPGRTRRRRSRSCTRRSFWPETCSRWRSPSSAALLWLFLETPAPERGRRGVGPGARPPRRVPSRPASGRRDGAARSGDSPDHRGPHARRGPRFFDSSLAVLRVLRAVSRSARPGRRTSRGTGARASSGISSLTLFVGPIALAGLLRGKRNPPTGWRFARTLFAVAVVLCRRRAGSCRTRGSRLPSPIPLRYPEKFMVGATFALALAAGIAFDRWRQFRTGGRGLAGGRRRSRRFSPPPRPSLPTPRGGWSWPSLGGAPELVPLAARALPPRWPIAGSCGRRRPSPRSLAAGRGPRAVIVLALILLTAIPLVRQPADRPDGPRRNGLSADGVRAGDRAPRSRRARSALSTRRSTGPLSPLLAASTRADPAGSEFYRQSWYYFTQTIWRRGTVLNIDLDAGDLSRIESLRRLAAVAAAQTDSAPFFSTLSLRYAIRFRDQTPIAGFRPLRRRRVPVLGREPGRPAGPAPGLALARGDGPRRRSPDAAAGCPPTRSSSRPENVGRARARPGKLRIREKSPERLLLETQTPDPTWLFVLRGDWSYRAVEIDGVPVQTLPAQLAFTAVPVPAGAHTIEWREKAPGLEVSRYGPLAGGAAASADRVAPARRSDRSALRAAACGFATPRSSRRWSVCSTSIRSSCAATSAGGT